MKVYVLMSEGLDEAKEVVYHVEGVYEEFSEGKRVANRLEKESKLTNPPSYSMQVRELGTETVEFVWLRHPNGDWVICWPLGVSDTFPGP